MSTFFHSHFAPVVRQLFLASFLAIVLAVGSVSAATIAPTEAHVSNSTVSSAEISWIGGGGGATHFIIAWCIIGPTTSLACDYSPGYTVVANVPATQHSYTFPPTSLNPNHHYRFGVAAGDGLTPISAYTFTEPIYTLARAPIINSLHAQSPSQITVSFGSFWGDHTADHYIENSTAGTNSGWITTKLHPLSNEYYFTDLKCNTLYSFRVKARNAEGIETAFSPTVNSQTGGCGTPPILGTNPIVIEKESTVIIRETSSPETNKATLLLNVSGATDMSISQNFTLYGSQIPWQPYQPRVVYYVIPSKSALPRILYLRFRSATGGESAVQSIDVPIIFAPGDSESPDQQPLPARVFFTRHLTVGSTGAEVRALQTLLKKLGYFTHPTITGYFGSVTKAAVIKLQKADRLSPYPGSVGPQTRRVLNSYLAQ